MDKNQIKSKGFAREYQSGNTTQIHGDLAAYVTIADMHGTVEAFLFPDVYEAVRDLLKDDNPVVIPGYAERGEASVKIIAEAIRPGDKGENA